ncbi:head-tail adaptor protein [Roseovarius sp. SCSIO 43702]|uniref:head-tail adaptor protein n=1 Tax=Roseovarius sp. SCSIO 43702 TaxID=2823043 RepID=UPI001C72C06A|nr:head-tail adaptor protein [Roseovarius sp. SCSIO 43702]QYX56703.1 head-tail adaptor protein [Roseovarius sp. SCSIO 43702]
MARVHLNRLLTLESPRRVADGAGGYAETWQEIGQLWGDISARTGREAVIGETPRSTTGYRITVRAAPHGAPSRPRPHQRFRDGARLYRIEAVTDRDPHARFLTCYCEEEVAV